jgi:multidrug resistance efflux pump
MADTELRSRAGAAPNASAADRLRTPDLAPRRRSRIRILPLLLTLIAIVVAVGLWRMMWRVYMEAPWTRDGTVRAYVVTMAPQAAGQIVELPVADNQFVHKGDLLMVIDPTNYRIAVSLAKAALEQAQANAKNVEKEAQRRQELTNLAVTKETQQTYETDALVAQAQVQQAQANLDQARVNLRRTEIRSPVNGWVTNLLAQLGDYAKVGQNEISLVDADSFWVDGYFEETNLDGIQVGDPAEVKLMGYQRIIRGHVGSIARGINVPNAQPNALGLAQVNPIFTWVRLAQRIPVRIHIDHVPEGVVLSAGETATVEIQPRPSEANQAPASDPLMPSLNGVEGGPNSGHSTAAKCRLRAPMVPEAKRF